MRRRRHLRRRFAQRRDISTDRTVSPCFFVIAMLYVEVLAVPKNMKLLGEPNKNPQKKILGGSRSGIVPLIIFALAAIPLFELYDNTARYGPQLAALVTALSK